MSYFINNQQHLNAIIFANRNKNYGAYAIRSAYGNTIFKSLFAMVLLFGTVTSLAFYLSNRNNTPQENTTPILLNDSTITTVFELKPEERLEMKPKSIKESKAQAADTKPESRTVTISDSLSIETYSVLDTEIKTAQTTSTAVLGFDTSDQINKCTLTTKTETAGGINTSGNANELFFVDSQPEFEGGLKALYTFIGNNLKYPNQAFEEGRQGTVYVKFVVDEKGKVGNLKLLNTMDADLNAEALRVVSMIPNFKTPAKVNGQAVKVYYQLPIKFKYAK